MPHATVSRMKDAASQRARARRRWPVRLTTLREQPGDDLSSTTTLEERIAMMRPLAEAAWRVAGLPMPRYSRSRIPVRLLVRRGGKEIEIPLPRPGTRQAPDAFEEDLADVAALRRRDGEPHRRKAR